MGKIAFVFEREIAKGDPTADAQQQRLRIGLACVRGFDSL